MPRITRARKTSIRTKGVVHRSLKGRSLRYLRVRETIHLLSSESVISAALPSYRARVKANHFRKRLQILDHPKVTARQKKAARDVIRKYFGVTIPYTHKMNQVVPDTTVATDEVVTPYLHKRDLPS
jgi:hypothetical protein